MPEWWNSRCAGFQTRDIAKLCEQGSLEKVKTGLSKLSSNDVTSGYVDVNKAMHRGSHLSAILLKRLRKISVLLERVMYK